MNFELLSHMSGVVQAYPWDSTAVGASGRSGARCRRAAPGQDVGAGRFSPAVPNKGRGPPARTTPGPPRPNGLPGGSGGSGEGRALLSQQEGGGGCAGAGELGWGERCGGSRGSERGFCGLWRTQLRGRELRIVSPQRLLSFSSRPAPSITPRHHQEMIPNQL